MDLASAALFLLENYDDPETVNVGVGEQLSVKELAELVREVVGIRRAGAGRPQASRYATQAARRDEADRSWAEG